MVSPRLNPQASWEFEAEILVLHHPTTISPRYQAMGEKIKPVWSLQSVEYANAKLSLIKQVNAPSIRNKV